MAGSEPWRWPVHMALKEATAQGLAGIAQGSLVAIGLVYLL